MSTSEKIKHPAEIRETLPATTTEAKNNLSLDSLADRMRDLEGMKKYVSETISRVKSPDWNNATLEKQKDEVAAVQASLAIVVMMMRTDTMSAS